MRKRTPRSIGIRELKLRATQIARSVREQGQPYVLTNRGRPFAVISPLPRNWETRVLEEALQEGPTRAQPVLPGRAAVDGVEIARAVAKDLRRLYGRRLRRVILFGSWARGEAHAESDIDLLVALDRVSSPWKEEKRMDDILWRHSFDNGTVVTAIPVSKSDFEPPKKPFLIRAVAEGVVIE